MRGKRGSESENERGPRKDQEDKKKPRECVAKMAQLYRNQKLGDEKEAQGLERFRVGSEGEKC